MVRFDLTREEARFVKLMFVSGTLCWCIWFLSGCGIMSIPNPMDDGHILLAADEKGMRAFGDTMVGIANEAKTPENMKSSHYQLREKHEEEETKRQATKFWSRVFGSGGAK